MYRKWVILAIIVLIYLPVSIDATVLHVAIPTLSTALSLSANEMLWVIDIYSLIMAGLILPMGALGDRIGFKRLMLIGASIFGVASLMAAFSNSAYMLIVARAFLGVGAAMILPATLAGVRNTFLDEKQRNYALGIWGTVGGGGAAFGPLLGGFMLEHFSWGTVFLINVPIIILVVILITLLVPKQAIRTKQPLNLLQAFILVSAISMLIYSVKTSIYAFSFSIVLIFAVGLGLLIGFVRHQLRTAQPMIDFSLFKNPVISTSIVMAIVAMIALVGFELLLSQELQFVYGYTPLEAGLFILPFMVAVSLSGFFASILINRFGVRWVSIMGLTICAIALIGLAQTNFTHQQYQAWFWMIMLGFWVEATFLASTSAIISTSPVEKATAAGSIEGMAYELGTGFGVAIFGLLASYFYSINVQFQPFMSNEGFELAKNSIGETVQILSSLDMENGAMIRAMANDAFLSAHQYVLYLSSLTLIILTLFIYVYWSNKEAK